MNAIHIVSVSVLSDEYQLGDWVCKVILVIEVVAFCLHPSLSQVRSIQSNILNAFIIHWLGAVMNKESLKH